MSVKLAAMLLHLVVQHTGSVRLHRAPVVPQTGQSSSPSSGGGRSPSSIAKFSARGRELKIDDGSLEANRRSETKSRICKDCDDKAVSPRMANISPTQGQSSQTAPIGRSRDGCGVCSRPLNLLSNQLIMIPCGCRTCNTKKLQRSADVTFATKDEGHRYDKRVALPGRCPTCHEEIRAAAPLPDVSLEDFASLKNSIPEVAVRAVGSSVVVAAHDTLQKAIPLDLAAMIMSYLPEGKVVNIKVFFDTRDPLSPVVERYLEFYPDGNLPHENAQAALAAGAQPQQVEPASPIKAAEQPPRYTKPLVLRLPGLSKYKHLRTKLAALGYDAEKYSRMFVGDLLMFSDESILNNKRFTKIEDDGYVHVICRDKQWRPSDVPENNRVTRTAPGFDPIVYPIVTYGDSARLQPWMIDKMLQEGQNPNFHVDDPMQPYAQMRLIMLITWVGAHRVMEQSIVPMMRSLLRYGANPGVFSRHIAAWKELIANGCDATLLLCDALEIDLSKTYVPYDRDYITFVTKALFHARHILKDAGVDIFHLIPEGFRRMEYTDASMERLDVLSMSESLQSPVDAYSWHARDC